MQLTLFTDYSLRTLMYLSMHQNRLCTVKEIADKYGISRNHMVKVVHRLAQFGYIESTKGKGGGIRLLKQPEEINLRKLIHQLEPSFALVECFDKKHNTCRIVETCKLKGILREALEAFYKTLENYTLVDTVSHPLKFKL